MNLEALSSATKYPSIETYHKLNPANGGLLPELNAQFTGQVIGTEKVDGAGGRIVVMPDGDYYIGSREELLYARGDRIENPVSMIVPVLKPLAERIRNAVNHPSDPVILFLEVYGHMIGGRWRNYAKNRAHGCQLFDIATTPVETLDWSRDRIASWREHGGQAFLGEERLTEVAAAFDIPLVPRIMNIDAAELPPDIPGMHALLRERLPYTGVALEKTAQLRPEGIVFRSPDRSAIVKARLQSYERTARLAQEEERNERKNAPRSG
jgi:RNA ligase-like protein